MQESPPGAGITHTGIHGRGHVCRSPHPGLGSPTREYTAEGVCRSPRLGLGTAGDAVVLWAGSAHLSWAAVCGTGWQGHLDVTSQSHITPTSVTKQSHQLPHFVQGAPSAWIHPHRPLGTDGPGTAHVLSGSSDYICPRVRFQISDLGMASTHPSATNSPRFFLWNLSLNDSKNSSAWQRV